MRRSLIVSGVLLALAVAVCALSDAAIERTLDGAEQLRLRVLAQAEREDDVGALEAVTQLALYWTEREPLMEMLTSHEHIRRVREEFVSGKLLLQLGDRDAFEEHMALLGEGLEHIRRHETVSLANIF